MKCQQASLSPRRIVRPAVLVLLVPVGLQLHAPEHAPLQRGAVDDDRVLLVVPRVAGDRDNRVLAGGQLAEVQVRHGARDAARGIRFLHGRGRGLTPADLPQVTRMLALSSL